MDSLPSYQSTTRVACGQLQTLLHQDYDKDSMVKENENDVDDIVILCIDIRFIK